jgi:hypothetical protein
LNLPNNKSQKRTSSAIKTNNGFNEEITRKAIEINNISAKYPLAQAIFACEEIINENHRERYNKGLLRLKRQLSVTHISDRKGIEEINKQIREFTLSSFSRISISVDYVSSMGIDGCRTLYLQSKNLFIITLSSELLQIENGHQLIKERIAHELGHIVLEYDRLIKIKSLVGSKKLCKNESIEKKVDVFANKLLALYDRNNLEDD